MAGKIKLLIVDDEERFLKTLAQRLSMRDFDVTAASDGELALEAAAKERFELALVDLKMPGISGERVLKLLKEKDPFIEVIILTGHGSVESAVECTRLGCFGYLQKPCETNELIQVLKNAYQARVQKKMKLDEERLEGILGAAGGESPLAILRRLRELEEKGE